MATAYRVKYDSKFEKKLHDVLKGCNYHTERLPYVQHKNYEPDFIYKDKSGFTYYIEAKGWFRDSAEARKYVDVLACLPDNSKLVFIFQNPNKKMPGAKRRKDGTYRTMKEWAMKYGIEYYTESTLPKEWTC